MSALQLDASMSVTPQDAGLCLRHGVHTQARPQAGASRCSAFQERRGGAIDCPEEGEGGRPVWKPPSPAAQLQTRA